MGCGTQMSLDKRGKDLHCCVGLAPNHFQSLVCVFCEAQAEAVVLVNHVEPMAFLKKFQTVVHCYLPHKRTPKKMVVTHQRGMKM